MIKPQIINLIKWLKQLHMPKKDRSIDEPLYADILLRIQVRYLTMMLLFNNLKSASG